MANSTTTARKSKLHLVSTDEVPQPTTESEMDEFVIAICDALEDSERLEQPRERCVAFLDSLRQIGRRNPADLDDLLIRLQRTVFAETEACLTAFEAFRLRAQTKEVRNAS